MATVPTRPVRRDADPVTPDPGAVRYQEDIVRSPILRGLLTFARLLIGWTFMWPFLDKLFGLGFATPSERAWVNGGMPSQGFMKNTTGPFADLFKNMAGTWTDWLFMAGLFGIGLAMLLGAGLKIAAWSGTLLLFLMYLAEIPPRTAGRLPRRQPDHRLALARGHLAAALCLWPRRRHLRPRPVVGPQGRQRHPALSDGSQLRHTGSGAAPRGAAPPSAGAAATGFAGRRVPVSEQGLTTMPALAA